MRAFRLVILAIVLAAAAAAVAALSAREAEAAAQKIGVIKTPNRTKAWRTARSIDQVVVHVTEGSFWGSVRWLRSRRSGGSSHYVVSREGRIVQMVDLKDVAWHAGNPWTNRRSIGIEHEGWTARGGFTKAQYEASARLLAYLSQRLGIRLDRRHVIGHDEVPNPYGPGRGGFDHHTDPGRHWRWGHYLALARKFARQPQAPVLVRLAPPAAPRPTTQPVAKERAVVCGRKQSVHTTTIDAGQRISSLVAWQAKTCGRHLRRVDFLVDGKRVGRDSVWPFQFAGGDGLNTTTLVNGWHTLTVRAYGRRGYRVSKSIRVRVGNKPFAVAPVGLGDGQAVRGTLGFRSFTNVPAKDVALALDGEVVARSEGRPHELEWDTLSVENGAYELELRAESVDGRTATRAFSVLVANKTPEPKLDPAPHVLWQSFSDWQLVSGAVGWSALVTGTIQQVEFWVDGRLRWTATEPPYAFGGEGGLWDSSSVEPGAHTLLVRAVGTGGRIAESRATIFVAAP